QTDMNRLDITRRKGLDSVLQLLRLDPKNTFEARPDFFLEHMSSMLPEGTVGVTFVKQQDGSFIGQSGLNADETLVGSLHLLPGEGAIGKAISSPEPRVLYGRSRVLEFLNDLHENQREILQQAFGEQGIPNLLVVSPVSVLENVVGVLLLGLFNISESDKTEWQRLLVLAGGLYSVRLTIGKLSQTPQPPPAIESPEEVDRVGRTLNQLNNHLSAIIGNAELAAVRGDLSGDVTVHFKSIIQEAEAAANFLRGRLGTLASPETGRADRESGSAVSDVIAATLDRNRISDSLFMVSGRPREINRSLNATESIEFRSEAIAELFENALDRFGAMIADEDVITVATYTRGEYLYLDISSHHRNFPAVRPVAEFGSYQFADDVLKYRPSDTFLEHVKDRACYYSFDQTASHPSYLSFKFPIRTSRQKPTEAAPGKARILAVDDQAIILDLLSAMCQTSGYSVTTADTAQQGLELALGEPFDIVLTDLAMPGMSGLEMAREIKKRKPDIPIVLITGWEVNLSPAQLEAAGITNVLYKPFRIEQLTDIIASIASIR
ncbi:MAG TPA: response regulator, partial [candidate division Zixibacteria bacterium]|nr:response regulator [candidate division Zixibacteria bacterium]